MKHWTGKEDTLKSHLQADAERAIALLVKLTNLKDHDDLDSAVLPTAAIREAEVSERRLLYTLAQSFIRATCAERF